MGSALRRKNTDQYPDKKRNSENIEYYTSLQNAQQRDSMLFIVCCIAAGVLAGGIAALIIVRRVRRKRASKVRIKRFR